jgi:hypothetical protein
MPPGVDERQNGGISPYHDVFQERFNQRYLKLVRKYSDIIVGQFFGHLHSDSFRIVYSDTGKMFVLPQVLFLQEFLASSIRNVLIRQLYYSNDVTARKNIPISVELGFVAFHGSGKDKTMMIMFIFNMFTDRATHVSKHYKF